MRILSIKEVQHKTSLGRSMIYMLMAEGGFPSSVRISPGRVGWLEDRVDEWIAAQAAGRGDELFW